MSLTRKDFNVLSATIASTERRIKQDDPEAALRFLTNELVSFCANQNVNFDRRRFLSGCGDIGRDLLGE